MEIKLAASVAVPFSSELDIRLRGTGLEGMKVKSSNMYSFALLCPSFRDVNTYRLL